MATSKTQRMAERNDFIACRIRQSAYTSWYRFTMNPTLTGSFYSEKFK